MARYNEAVCRLCRREGEKLYLKGERCFKDKCSFSKRPFPPGQHGKGRQKIGEYGTQLREKQKAKRIYGILEKQFRKYFKIAVKKEGISGENLLAILESRLDNVVFRTGFAESRASARQLINHGHFLVDGKRVDIPSYLVRPSQVIELKENSREIAFVAKSLESAEGKGVPSWLTLDKAKYKVVVERSPERTDVLYEINEQLIVELYSK